MSIGHLGDELQVDVGEWLSGLVSRVDFGGVGSQIDDFP